MTIRGINYQRSRQGPASRLPARRGSAQTPAPPPVRPHHAGPNDLEVAQHEAGHALMAWDLGLTITRCALEPRPSGVAGYLEHLPSDPYSELLVTVSGPAVNAVFGFAWDPWDAGQPGGDESAMRACLEHWAPDEREEVLLRASDRAEALVRANRRRLDRLAEVLLARGELTGAEVRAALAGG